MALTKIVNGVEVACSPAEEAAITAEWNDNAPGTGPKWQADQTAIRDALRVAAESVFADSSGDVAGYAKAMRALALLLLDELNAHAAKMNAILTAIDSGSTLAQVKSNIAAIADYPARTAVQVKTAIRNKITVGDADS